MRGVRAGVREEEEEADFAGVAHAAAAAAAFRSHRAGTVDAMGRESTSSALVASRSREVKDMVQSSREQRAERERNSCLSVRGH